MKALLALLLCLILPFQSVWSVAAQFCQHETTIFNTSDFDQTTLISQHFGHHLHPAHSGDALEQPQAKQSLSVADLSATDTDGGDLTQSNHDDHIGHFDCGLRLDALAPDAVQTEAWLIYRAFDPVLYQSPMLTLPETPSWLPLATGGVAVL
ncbi:MAG: hypothetical protein VXW65_15540 [Pseudomonadota bacterium]|nr:hypothetical protein [Pseudomonadota bacterium]